MRAEGSTMAAGGGYGGDHTTALPSLVFRERPPAPPSPTRLRQASEAPSDKAAHSNGPSRKGQALGSRPDEWSNPLTLSRAKVQEIISLYESGVSTNKVSDQTGVAKSTILRHLKANGVEIRGSVKPLDMDAIAKAYAAGASARELGRQHGVAPVTIMTRLRKAGKDVRDGR